MSSSAGWIGEYCYRHTVGVVKAQLRQIWSGYAVYIQRYMSPAELADQARKQRERFE